MKTKKFILGIATVAIVVVSASMMAAFEAHIINVTAKIENALRVPIDHINFGTVFPQEELEQNIDITLSQSFLDEDRVDDVEYIIRQKPKCGWTMDNGEILLDLPTMTGHIDDTGEAVCPDAPIDAGQPAEATWGQLPFLCPYLSKHKSDVDANQSEVEIDAFHEAWYVDPTSGEIVYTEAKGRLAKSDNDIEDNWIIDLKVPCFGDYCAQDWEEFVRGINPDAIPADFVQDIADEHKVFGCDLWIEVVEVSEENGDIGCMDKADVMLVLDRSGSISSTELTTLKTAATDFVTTLSPTSLGVHMGQTSFASTANLDQHLTDSAASMLVAISGLTSGGLTNLEDALLKSTAELANPGDTHDRIDSESPDYMVIITDGAPTASNTGGDHEANAAAAADAARAAGAKIYVVGVGTNTTTASYLSNEIANHSGQYFDVTDYSGLSAVLDDIATCNTP